MIKVSIVVPVYNVQDYLVECVDSILKQSYTNIEIILVDDGSPDDCGKICDSYAKLDGRIKVVHRENGGLSAARNTGLDNASGEYILFFDSDDILHQTAIEVLVKKAIENKLDFVLYEATNFSNTLIDYATENWYKIIGNYDQVYSGEELLQKLLNNNCFRTPVQLYLYNLGFIKNHNMRFHEGIIHEDWEYTFFAFYYAKRVMVEQTVLYDHRIRNDSIMGRRLSQKNIDGYYTSLMTLIKHIKISSPNCFRELVNLLYQCLIEGFDQSTEQKVFRNIKYRLLCLLKLFFRLFYCKRSIIIASVRSIIPVLLRNKLRNIYHIIKRNKIDTESKQIIRRLKESQKSEGRIIVLCCPHLHGNRGDLAISYAQKQLLENNFVGRIIIEVPTLLCEFHAKTVLKYLKSKDVICICGGGWLGSLWRHNQMAAFNIVREFPNNKIVIFPQTIYYSSDSDGKKEFETDKNIFAKCKRLSVCLRDSRSYEYALNSGLFPNSAKILLTPDMVLSLQIDELKLGKGASEGVLYCLRDDSESELTDEIRKAIIEYCKQTFQKCESFSTNSPNSPIPLSKRTDALRELLDTMNKVELIITDRLHCMVFAYLLGKPCIVYDNLTNKVKGVYKWIEKSESIMVLNPNDDFKEAIKKVTKSSLRTSQTVDMAQILRILKEE